MYHTRCAIQRQRASLRFLVVLIVALYFEPNLAEIAAFIREVWTK